MTRDDFIAITQAALEQAEWELADDSYIEWLENALKALEETNV